jgi:hypothetical protein
LYTLIYFVSYLRYELDSIAGQLRSVAASCCHKLMAVCTTTFPCLVVPSHLLHIYRNAPNAAAQETNQTRLGSKELSLEQQANLTREHARLKIDLPILHVVVSYHISRVQPCNKDRRRRENGFRHLQSMRTFLESWGNAQCRRLIHLVCSFCVPATAPIRYDLAGDTEILARRPRLSR